MEGNFSRNFSHGIRELVPVCGSFSVGMKQIQGKRHLVRVIGRFKKPRVRDIGILLYLVCIINSVTDLSFTMQSNLY